MTLLFNVAGLSHMRSPQWWHRYGRFDDSSRRRRSCQRTRDRVSAFRRSHFGHVDPRMGPW
jgi:hypothetical protein